MLLFSPEAQNSLKSIDEDYKMSLSFAKAAEIIRTCVIVFV